MKFNLNLEFLPRRDKVLITEIFEETKFQIRHDLGRSSEPLRALLDYAESRIFDRGLKVKNWKRACGIRANTIELKFRKVFGLSPSAYVTARRMETASKLLLWTELRVWQVGTLVGFSSLGTFSRAFERWSGIRPNAFRRTEGWRSFHLHTINNQEDRLRAWRLALVGKADSMELKKFLDNHNSADAPRKQSSGKKSLDASRGSIRPSETVRCNRIWKKIKDLRFAEQRAIVRCQIGFETSALFDLLREKSRQEGRIDGERGVSLAKLALESLEACEDSLGDDLHNRQAQGWIWLGNAQRLDFSFLKAEQSFVVAEAKLRLASESHDRLVAAELNYYRAALRWYQRQYEDASELAGRATAQFRELDHRSYLAQSLILESGIQRQKSSCTPELDQLSEALNLIDASEPYLLATCYSHLAVAHIRRESFDAATQAVSRAKEICQNMNYQMGLCRSLWLEGQVCFGRGDNESAKDCYERACVGFDNLGEVLDIAAVKLDLAILYETQGQGAKVLKLVAEILPVFEALKIRREAYAAIRLLRRGVETNKITMAILLKVRLHFDDVAHEPWSRERLRKIYKRENS